MGLYSIWSQIYCLCGTLGRYSVLLVFLYFDFNFKFQNNCELHTDFLNIFVHCVPQWFKCDDAWITKATLDDVLQSEG